MLIYDENEVSPRSIVNLNRWNHHDQSVENHIPLPPLNASSRPYIRPSRRNRSLMKLSGVL